MSDTRWGIWGGLHPGGWCWIADFDNVRGDDANPYCVATRADAEAALPQFTTDARGMRYEVVPFDEGREPESQTDARPSPAMLDALDRINRLGTLAVIPRLKQSTIAALYARGWVMHRPVPISDHRPVALTKAGRAVLVASGATVLR